MAWVERGVSGAGVGSQGMGSRGVSTPVATGIPASYTGLITGKHEDILGQGLNHINRSTGYEYDSSGRLASALVPDKILSTYYYDARGNLTYSSVQDLQTYATDVTEYTYSGDLIYSATHNDTTCYFSHNSLGGVTYDGLSKRVIQYSYIGFPAKILDENYTVLAEYCYLADGTKLSAERADGTGFVYRGSLKYTLGSGGAITLLGAEIPAGLLTPGGSRYRVTDHLGSVVYELNAAGGTLADGGLYDAWGVRSGIAGSAASPTSLHHFTGQEDQAPGLGVPYTDFGARNYSPALGRWLTPDPLSEKYYGISPYAYCAGDPVNKFDGDGRKIYFAKGSSPQFKKAFAEAVKIMNAKGTSYNLARLEKSDIVFYVSEGENQYDPNSKKISWDPSYVPYNKETGLLRSPLTTLAHESGHAANHLKAIEEGKEAEFFEVRIKAVDPQYNTKDDRIVITTTEQYAARRHGEITGNQVTRYNHRGSPYPGGLPDFSGWSMAGILQFVVCTNQFGAKIEVSR